MAKKNKRVNLSKHGRYIKKYPCQNLFLDFKEKQYLFRKYIKGKQVKLVVKFHEITNERDYLEMIDEWTAMMAENGDGEATDLMDNKKFNNQLDCMTSQEYDFESSPRTSTFFDNNYGDDD